MSRRNRVQIVFGLIFGGAMIAVAWAQFQDANARSSEATVLLAADSYLRTLEAVRDVYTSEVVNRLPESVLVTYDYDLYDNAVPLPATFTMALAENLGSVESLVTHPVTMTHADMGPAERARVGITDSMVRLSVGLEDAVDLIEDLSQALDRT